MPMWLGFLHFGMWELENFHGLGSLTGIFRSVAHCVEYLWVRAGSTLSAMADRPSPVFHAIEEKSLIGTMAIYDSQDEASQGIPLMVSSVLWMKKYPLR